MAISAAAAKEAIEHVCNCLAYFGITNLNPEAFRQAKLGNVQVSERFWGGLFQLIILKSHSFGIRNVSVPEDSSLVKHFVSYMLQKWGSPIPLRSENPQYLLLSLSYALHFTDFFAKYDDKDRIAPIPFMPLEELSRRFEEFLQVSMPQVNEADTISMLNLFRGLQNQIADTFKEIAHTGQMVYALHEQDPSLQLEDIWISQDGSRMEYFENTISYSEQLSRKKEKETKMRTVFWKWIDKFVESLEDFHEPQEKKQPSNEFVGGIESVCYQLGDIVNSVETLWGKNKQLFGLLSDKWGSVNQMIISNAGHQWTEYVDTLTQDLENRFVPIAVLSQRMQNASNIPPLIQSRPADTSEPDESLLKKLRNIQSEINTLSSKIREDLLKKIKISQVKTYNF